MICNKFRFYRIKLSIIVKDRFSFNITSDNLMVCKKHDKIRVFQTLSTISSTVNIKRRKGGVIFHSSNYNILSINWIAFSSRLSVTETYRSAVTVMDAWPSLLDT